jgi:hypothetical protein
LVTRVGGAGGLSAKSEVELLEALVLRNGATMEQMVPEKPWSHWQRLRVASYVP